MRSKLSVIHLTIGLLLIRAAVAIGAAPATQASGHERWEKQIAAMEARDKTNPPPKNGFVFIGSSMIARWKTLADDFPGQPVINRGFGGSEISDSTYFADRLIFPLEPKMVLLRAGGNDIHAHKSPEQVFSDFKDFVAKVHEKLPETTVVFIGQSPAPSRWDERDANKKLDDLVSAWVKDQPKVKYVECFDISLTPDGQPREELFVADRLHFNAEGYKLLTERVRPVLSGAQ